MLSDDEQAFRLGPWTVDPMRGAISGPGGEAHHLEPKVMQVLVLLARDAGRLVTRDRLLDAVWSRHVAADQLLTRAISELRRVLDDQKSEPLYIETVPKRGYRLVGEVRAIEAGTSPPHLPTGPGAGRKSRQLVVAGGIAAMLAVALLAYDRLGGDRVVDGSATDAAAASAPTLSIAVLPFVNMSDDAANEYFAEGLAEEVRSLLATVPGAKVTARTSSSAFRDAQDVRIVGEVLGVDSVLEGAVRKSGDRVRITAQLIDASDRTTVWSGAYDRSMDDIFDVQEEVAAAIIDALNTRVGIYPERGRPTESAEAYASFLKAQMALNVQDPAAARAELLRAVELDPRFAEAYELLSHVYWTDIPEIEAAEEQQLMRDAAARALAIDPDLDFARVLLLEGTGPGHSLAEVLEAQAVVIRKQPGDPQALRTVTWNLMISGYLDEALRMAERYVEVDPLSSIAHVRHAAVLSAAGRKAESMAALQVAHELAPDSLEWYIGEAYLVRGDDRAAIPLLETGFRQRYEGSAEWIRELVTGARDPLTGQAYLDRSIPRVVRSLPSRKRELEEDLNRFYLFFGHLDRYFQIMLDEISDRSPSSWITVQYYLSNGVVYRETGFTAHPRYLEVAEALGFFEVWKRQGAPDFCTKADDRWVCR